MMQSRENHMGGLSPHSIEKPIESHNKARKSSQIFISSLLEELVACVVLVPSAWPI